MSQLWEPINDSSAGLLMLWTKVPIMPLLFDLDDDENHISPPLTRDTLNQGKIKICGRGCNTQQFVRYCDLSQLQE